MAKSDTIETDGSGHQGLAIDYPLHKLNVCVFVLLMILGGFHVGFSIGSANQLATLFNVKYGWTTESEKSIH